MHEEEFIRNKYIRVALVLFVLLATFVLVYSPHLGYKYLYHYDEWRGLTGARRIVEGTYTTSSWSLEYGFHYFLSLLYRVTDLFEVYRFLPAIWACLGSIIIFFMTRSIVKRFDVSLFAMIFFASIKSNADNLLGMWYFTPLTFCIPFIFLFVWLFREGIETDTLWKYDAGVIAYLILAVSHPISASFLIPAILIYGLIRWRFFVKHWLTTLCCAVIVPYTVFWFYHTVTHHTFSWNTFNRLLYFTKADWAGFNFVPVTWGYSFVGLGLALVGLVWVVKNRQWLLLLWTSTTLLPLAWYLFHDYSVFAPYLRMFYYLIISLPLLSAIGLYYVLKHLRTSLRKGRYHHQIVGAIYLGIVCLIIGCTFYNYFDTSRTRQFITDADAQALRWLGTNDTSHTKMIAPWDSSVAAYALSGHPIIGDEWFYDGRPDETRFFDGNCTVRRQIVMANRVAYVNSRDPLDCGWSLVYDQEGEFIYKTVSRSSDTSPVLIPR